MADASPTEPFFLIVADFDLGRFTVEGPMTDEQPWIAAARRARDNQRRIVCGPAGPAPEMLAAEYQREHNLGGAPPGSIVRPRG